MLGTSAHGPSKQKWPVAIYDITLNGYQMGADYLKFRKEVVRMKFLSKEDWINSGKTNVVKPPITMRLAASILSWFCDTSFDYDERWWCSLF